MLPLQTVVKPDALPVPQVQSGATNSTFGKSKHALRCRFKRLKARYGNDLSLFPRHLYRPVLPASHKKRTKVKETRPTGTLMKVLGVASGLNVLELYETGSTLSVRPTLEAHKIVHEMFKDVTRSQIHQHSGEAHLNCGEIACDGVSRMLSAMEDVCDSDFFVDIGCGIGNVVAQVALETPVRMCFGVEVQEDVVALAKRVLRVHSKQHHDLSKVSLSCCDIRSPQWHVGVRLGSCTILYANNILFERDVDCVLEEFTCEHKRLRYVVLLKKICHRHRQNCTRLFCALWKLHVNLKVQAHWTSSLVDLYVYKRES